MKKFLKYCGEKIHHIFTWIIISLCGSSLITSLVFGNTWNLYSQILFSTLTLIFVILLSYKDYKNYLYQEKQELLPENQFKKVIALIEEKGYLLLASQNRVKALEGEITILKHEIISLAEKRIKIEEEIKFSAK